MATRTKKFDACLLRIDGDQFVVAEWHQLVTTGDKSKLTVGSSVGYKQSTKTRDKTIRGTIIVTGSVSACEQQMKLLTSKVNKKKIKEKKVDEEVPHVAQEMDSPNVDDDVSSDSNDESLNSDSEDEIGDDVGATNRQSEQVKASDEAKKNEKQKLNMTSRNAERKEGESKQLTNSSSCKRKDSDGENEDSAPKRQTASMARLEGLIVENDRLKKQVDIYKKEWMPRPTEPAVIRYFIRMGKIFSSIDEGEETKGDKLTIICDRLKMNEEQLNRLKKGNGTKTARAIVRACFPSSVRPTITLDDIDDEYRGAVHDYVNMFHGMECLTEGKINASINNVFRSAKSQQKEKNPIQPLRQSNNHNSTKNKGKRMDNGDKNKENVNLSSQ